MGLNEDAGLALVAFAQILAGFHGFGKALIECIGLGNSLAVAAAPAEVGQAIFGEGPLQAVHGLGNHLRQGELSRAARAGKNDGVGQMIAGDHLAQACDRRFISAELIESHA